MSGRTSVFWGCLPTTRPCESRGRVTLENTDQISIVPICGGNAEIDLLALVVGRFLDEARAGKARMETDAQGIFVKAPIIIVIGSYPRAANLITKTEIARRLHEMVDERLFGTNLGRWKKRVQRR